MEYALESWVEVDIDLCPRDPKSISFLLESSTYDMLSLVVFRQNCHLYRARKEKYMWRTDRGAFHSLPLYLNRDISIKNRDISIKIRDISIKIRDICIKIRDISILEIEISLFLNRDISIWNRDISIWNRDISIKIRDICIWNRDISIC